jgi:outer membrane protein assembly factor BamB
MIARHAESGVVLTKGIEHLLGRLGTRAGVLVGSGESCEALETDLVGREIGETGTVEITPGDGETGANAFSSPVTISSPDLDIASSDVVVIDGIPHLVGDVTGNGIELRPTSIEESHWTFEYEITDAYHWAAAREDDIGSPDRTRDNTDGLWSTFRGNPSRTAYAPDIDAPTEEPDIEWFVEADLVSPLPPVVDGSNVYVGDDSTMSSSGRLLVLSRETGNLEREFDVDSTSGGVTVHGGVAYFGDDLANTLHVMDVESAEVLAERWTAEYERRLQGAPAVVDDTVFLTSGFSLDEEGHVYALDRADGSERWKRTLDYATKTAPTVTEDAVIVGSRDQCVYALSRDSGDTLWSYETGSRVDYTVSARDGRAYIDSWDDASSNRIFAVDAETGEELWRSDEKAYAPIADGQRVYASGSYGGFYALDAATGDTEWELDADETPAHHPVAVTSDTVYTGSVKGGSSEIGAINVETGEVRWVLDLGLSTNTPPAIADDRLYLALDRVVALEPPTGGTG